VNGVTKEVWGGGEGGKAKYACDDAHVGRT